jgi:hypothetical protein
VAPAPPEVVGALAHILREVLNGPPGSDAWLLNRDDRGLLASLAQLSASEASQTNAAGSSIAAHAEHLRYGLSLMNRWMAGEDGFATADWAAAWRRPRVSDAKWATLLQDLGEESRQWLAAVAAPARWDDATIKGIIASTAHLAYHLGAIRQMSARAAGPRQAL